MGSIVEYGMQMESEDRLPFDRHIAIDDADRIARLGDVHELNVGFAAHTCWT